MFSPSCSQILDLTCRVLIDNRDRLRDHTCRISGSAIPTRSSIANTLTKAESVARAEDRDTETLGRPGVSEWHQRYRQRLGQRQSLCRSIHWSGSSRGGIQHPFADAFWCSTSMPYRRPVRGMLRPIGQVEHVQRSSSDSESLMKLRFYHEEHSQETSLRTR